MSATLRWVALLSAASPMRCCSWACETAVSFLEATFWAAFTIEPRSCIFLAQFS